MLINGFMKMRANILDKAPITTREYTQDGYLRAQAAITREGLFKYDASELGVGDKGETITLKRTKDSIFNPETISSARGTPVTLTHPSDGVTPANWQDVSVGNLVGEPKELTKGRLGTEILIGAQDGIAALQDGVNELSIGYSFDFKKAGPNDGDCDYVSDGPIHINHVAIVEKGRAGKDVKVFDKAGSNTVMDMAEIKKAVSDSVREAIGSSDGKQKSLDERTISDGILSAISPALTEMKKTVEDAAQKQAEAQLKKDEAEALAAAKKNADELVAATIKERDAFHSAIADALSFIPEEKHADMRSKDLREVLLTAIGDSIPNAAALSDDALRGALITLKAVRQKNQDSSNRTAHSTTTKIVGDAATARDEAYRKYVSGFTLNPSQMQDKGA